MKTQHRRGARFASTLLLGLALVLCGAGPSRADDCVPEPLAYCYVPFSIPVTTPVAQERVLLVGSFCDWSTLVANGAIEAVNDGENWTAVGFFDDGTVLSYRFLLFWTGEGSQWCLPDGSGGIVCDPDILPAELVVDCGMSVCEPVCEPACSEDEQCVDGVCEPIPCEPDCLFDDGSPKACGPDGCDGVCGECEDGLHCVDWGCVPDLPSVDVVGTDVGVDAGEDAGAADAGLETSAPSDVDAGLDAGATAGDVDAGLETSAPSGEDVGGASGRGSSSGCDAGGRSGGLVLLVVGVLALSLRRRSVLLLLVVVAVACSGEDEASGNVHVDAVDASTLDVVLAEVGLADVPSTCGEYCPAGFCDESTGLCEYCEEDDDCRLSTRVCVDNLCVDAVCAPESARCVDLRTIEICDSDGMGWTSVACHEDTACVADACQTMICEEGETKCDGTELMQCGPTRTSWLTYPCPIGSLCSEGTCRSLRSNLVVIFDTSGSMADPVDCFCEDCAGRPFPYCEQDECPRTLMGLAKKAFRALIDSQEFHTVNTALLHFPMHADATPNSCAYGFYEANDLPIMTGDDDAHETAGGDWFDQNLHEILAVRFPWSADDDTVVRMAQWFDNDEVVAPTDVVCDTDADCPGGFCRELSGEALCWYHTNPEMRSHGGTPLGKMLFYAGEVFRKQIHVEGRECRNDADCANPNYTCEEGACHDKYRHCRTNMILLLTDGVDASPAGWFHPLTQAKRLRYGLCCESDRDCFDGASCLDSGVCGDYPHVQSEDTTESDVADGPCRLVATNGEPLQIYVHVIDVSLSGSGAEANRQLADAGGGQYHYAVQLDADTLLQQMLQVLDAKVWLEQCVDL